MDWFLLFSIGVLSELCIDMSAGHYYPYGEIYEFFQKDPIKTDAFCKMRREQPKGFLGTKQNTKSPNNPLRILNNLMLGIRQT